MILLKIGAVGTRTHVIAVYPRARNQLNKVLVSVVVFGKHYEVVSAHVALLFLLVVLCTARHIHLAAEYGLERLLALGLQLAVDFLAVVVKLLYAEHVAVVGYGHALHAVGHSLVDKFLHARLSVKNGVISMYV